MLKKQGVKDTADEDLLDEIGISLLGPRSAVLWFEAPDAAPGTQFGVYRAALPEAGKGKKREDGPEVLAEIRSLQLLEGKAMGKEGVDPSAGRKWTLLMFGGGHFAGMVVSLVPRLVSKGKGKEKEREVVIIEKKTFHRYTSESGTFTSAAVSDPGHHSSSQARRITVSSRRRQGQSQVCGSSDPTLQRERSHRGRPSITSRVEG